MPIVRLMIIIGIILLLVAIPHLQARPVYMQARIFFDTPEDLVRLKAQHLDIVVEQDTFLEMVVFPDDLNKITELGFRTEVIHEDLTAFFQSRLDISRDMGGYKTLDEIIAYIDGMKSDHSNIVSSLEDIGQSLEGRMMWAVKISDNPDIDEDEPEILYTGVTHAREVITPEVLLYFMDHLTNNYGTDPEVTFLVDNREIWFVPVVNVDGYRYNETIAPGGGGMWRKNRRDNGDGSYGVDLNRNWGLMWGYNDLGSSPDPSNEIYRGAGPFSEPESQNMRDFITTHEFTFVVDYHSYTNMIFRPYGYNSSATPDEVLYRVLADTLRIYNGYGHGIMGINGCTSDWEYGEQTDKNKNIALLFEVGNVSDNFWPPLYRVPQLVSENLMPNMLLAYFAADPMAVFPPTPPVLILPEIVSAVEYQVEWEFTDLHNQADSYELIEYQLLEDIVDPAISLDSYSNNGFSVSDIRYYSNPTSFYSGESNNSQVYFDTQDAFDIGPGDVLEFQTYYDIQERYDYAYVEVSTDGVDFIPIEGNITTNFNPNGLNRGNGITGSSGGWVHGLFDLSDYTGQAVYFRFSYYTDQAYSGEGFYVDDIYPANGFISENVISSIINNSYYTIAGQPDGVYYYKVRVKDYEDQWSEFSESEKTTVKSPFICGDTDGDELVNILDIVYLINYLYKSGPVPVPVDAADVNHGFLPDGLINILDIVYLINYLYKSGAEPICP